MSKISNFQSKLPEISKFQLGEIGTDIIKETDFYEDVNVTFTPGVF